MKILTVLGARPQFIKAAAVSRKIREDNEEIILHTGQHYDTNMSDIFFKELNLPLPDYNLNAGSASHAKQTADILVGTEDLIISEKPDCVLVYGDTNSTLAGALAAAKLNVPIAHVEAGLRSFNRRMPEEQNRVLTDKLSTLLFCPTQTAVNNLEKEGIFPGVYNVGDVMLDALLYYKDMNRHCSKESFFSGLTGLFTKIPLLESWYLATLHRAENTDIHKISQILSAFERLPFPVIFPVHPRIKKLISALFNEYGYKNIIFTEPTGYKNMLYFTENAVKVITDSGGLQKEAFMLGTHCVTVREETEWVETLSGNCNILAKPDEKDVYEKVINTKIVPANGYQPFGDGNAAGAITRILSQWKG